MRIARSPSGAAFVQALRPLTSAPAGGPTATPSGPGWRERLPLSQPSFLLASSGDAVVTVVCTSRSFRFVMQAPSCYSLGMRHDHYPHPLAVRLCSPESDGNV